MVLTFFGLTLEIAPQIRVNLFTQIHEILFHSKGGYDYNTIYNMPIWLRKFTFHKLQSFYEEESKAYSSANKNSNSTTLVDSSGKVNTPEFLKASKEYTKQPTYTTKALRK